MTRLDAIRTSQSADELRGIVWAAGIKGIPQLTTEKRWAKMRARSSGWSR